MTCSHCGGQMGPLDGGTCPQCGKSVAVEVMDAEVLEKLDEPVAPSQGADDLAILRALAGPFTYYWSIRRAAREQLWRTLNRNPQAAKEIELRPRDSFRTAYREGAAWSVTLPDCCAVCGGLSKSQSVRQSRQTADIRWPVGAPLMGFVLGALVALLLGSVWWLPVLFVPSFLAGYFLRRSVTVHMQLRRCKAHHEVTSIPEPFAFGNTLWLRTGHVAVVQQFELANGIAPSGGFVSGAEPVEAAPVVASPEPDRPARDPDRPLGEYDKPWTEILIQVAAAAAVLIVTPLAFKYAAAEFGLFMGTAISASMLYLIIGAAVLRRCCHFFAGGPPDYPIAMFAVCLAVMVWDLVFVYLARLPPPQVFVEGITAAGILQLVGYAAGFTITLFVVPALVYVWLLDVGLPLATLIFFIQHLVTSAIAIGLALAAIRLLPQFL